MLSGHVLPLHCDLCGTRGCPGTSHMHAFYAFSSLMSMLLLHAVVSLDCCSALCCMYVDCSLCDRLTVLFE